MINKDRKPNMATEEEDNYVRVALLLNGVSSRAVRVYFDQEFAPSCLERTLRQGRNTLTDLKKWRVINQKQWNLLFPGIGRTPDSTSFDISLMTILLKKLASIAVPDHLPVDTDSSVEAALGIIKYYRNHLAHLPDSKIENNQFENMWTAISKAIKTIGGDLMYEETKKLKTNVIDRSNREVMLTLKQFSDEIKELKHNLQSLEQQVKDPVPQSIREVIQCKIGEWKEDDKNFFVTSAAKTILQCCEEQLCVLIIGSSGMGKTATLRHVALQMADKGFDLIPVQEPSEITQYYNPNAKTIFVVDDFCGKFSAKQFDVEKWEQFISHFCRYIKNDFFKLIISCRLQIYNDELFDTLTLFKSCVCDLTSKDFQLSDEDLQSIAEVYVNNANDVVQYAHLYECFPFLCKQYSECPSLGLDFFQRPYSVYKNELNQMFAKQNYAQFCALALCVMFNNCVKEEWLRENIDCDVRDIFENTFEQCKLNRGTSRLVILDSFETLLNTYLIKADNVYKVRHDKLFDIISHFFGKKMLSCMIQYANIKLIGERFVLQIIDQQRELSITVPMIYLELYIKRMVDDWKKGNVEDVLSNINFLNTQFLDIFCHHVVSLDKLKQIQLAKVTDIRYNINVLHPCCAIGNVKCTKWALENGASVDTTNVNQMFPLVLATINGHAEVANILLDHNACINLTTNDGMTSLYAACMKGNLKMVDVLLQRNADLNICADNGMTPLNVACFRGFPKIVSRILQEKKADINKGTTENGNTPLYVACANNHKEVVKMLLENKADVDKCTTNNGASPLYLACENNNIEIAYILLDYDACINLTINDGLTPLHIACANGHIEIVKLLLQRNADLNICSIDDGISPLSTACDRGFAEIVLRILLEKKAHINKGTLKKGVTPLIRACTNGHIQVVKMLLNNKADVNKCTTDIGASPLYVACQDGFTEIVTTLIKSKANINQSLTNTGATPLWIACRGGFKSIVEILLKKGANINFCTTDNGTTPLHIASFSGHIDIVKILLNHGADVNIRTTDRGLSPCDIAFMHGNKAIYNILINAMSSRKAHGSARKNAKS